MLSLVKNREADDLKKKKLLFFHHKRDGVSIQDLAEQNGLSVEEVSNSIKEIEDFYNLCTEETMKAAEIEIILSSADLQKKAIFESLLATRKVKDDKGRVRDVPDHATRLNAISKINEKLKSIMPPMGKSVNTQVNVMTGGQNGARPVISTSAAYEDRLSEIMENRKKFLPEAPKETIIDADVDEDEDDSENEPEIEEIAVESNTARPVS